MAQMNRLGEIPHSDLNADQQQLYEQITTVVDHAFGNSFTYKRARDGALLGPFGPWIHTPALTRTLFPFQKELAAIGGLPDKAREVAILVTGTHYSAAYEQYAHTAVGKHFGLSAPEIETIKAGARPESLDDECKLAYDVTAALLRGPLPEDMYQKAMGVFGKEGVVSLVHYVGFYAYVGVLMNGFDVKVPEE